MSDRESIKTTANDRAKFAYECVKKVCENQDEEFRKNYKSYSKKLMAMIKINGFGATLAFMKGSFQKKGGKAYKELYNNIDTWLKLRSCPVSSFYNNAEGRDMVEKVLSLESDSYRVITKEVMEFINWIRRFAEGMIMDD
ncbi:MAG: CRISPR-associated protein, Cmr5 family [Caldanaerobacter subterraneus]|nr:MAG: CRISPR-associated protein, Cmr5 family [Thermoanaerobacter thermocopriae]KUK35582.1 MAG: CRISPR-associated protein, Cmr5 family [Caldanaerobacter subterraneus]HAA81143.1 type III-B CRISPR module-associated protein Cmr5 [Thermoanaerobacter sp.]HCD10503.1 type III-B CRISPR module-associated protein Cmr5 [Thermoanaerobacter sp.]